MSMGCMQEYAAACVFPSPHSGILFLFLSDNHTDRKRLRVSVPSFGDSFFIPGVLAGYSLHYYCFRPLIRGFFFYGSTGT